MRQVISKDDKAVSPIIATILLIAITVVLAATLVTILGGFTKGASGSAANASVSPIQFTNNTTSKSSPNNVYINVTAFSVSGGVSSSKITFTVTITNSTGTTTLTGNLAKVTSPYTVTGPATFTGGSDYVISGYAGQINSVTVQLTYSGTVIYSSGTVT